MQCVDVLGSRRSLKNPTMNNRSSCSSRRRGLAVKMTYPCAAPQASRPIPLQKLRRVQMRVAAQTQPSQFLHPTPTGQLMRMLQHIWLDLRSDVRNENKNEEESQIRADDQNTISGPDSEEESEHYQRQAADCYSPGARRCEKLADTKMVCMNACTKPTISRP
eukprot:GHVT01093763.1.p1 GENE.GHVT01093763.1~~GHVT01093763.1.p1  ORF type:complete len:163 (-),score=19.30 GHVT01093763.1:246-734(-)